MAQLIAEVKAATTAAAVKAMHTLDASERQAAGLDVRVAPAVPTVGRALSASHGCEPEAGPTRLHTQGADTYGDLP